MTTKVSDSRYNLAVQKVQSQKSLKYARFAFSANFSYLSITWTMFIFCTLIACGLQLSTNDMMNSKVKVKTLHSICLMKRFQILNSDFLWCVDDNEGF